ncbi:EF-hand calcium-binding domain-containing protein 6-like [Anneissia japonica]|uniref:EF-hand calcium-binding domain-containing protein 6-like n=1 Tax=Anneissia japonica TaxID=1529436 RepID=UPI0014259250|nr:EF-hand calcium-binding domain-containing protein 6-like [Anneissia japonica]
MPTLSARHSSSRPANLPVIEHPLSRQAKKNTLNIIGSASGDVVSPRPFSRPTSVRPRREQGNLLPSLRPESCPLLKHHRMLTWPPVHEVKSGQQKASIPKQTVIGNSLQSRYSSDEITLDIVANSIRFIDTRYGLKLLTRIMRSNNKANSTLALLLKVFVLDANKTISFDEFMSAFRDSEVVQREWMSPYTRKEVCAQRKRAHTEDHLRDYTLGNHIKDGDYVSATYANALLKDKCQRSDFNLRDHLAPCCFGKKGVILPPQLQECLASIGALLDDYEMRKLWQRYDLENTGKLCSARFFHLLGLNLEGRPKVKVIPTVSSYGIMDSGMLQDQIMEAENSRNLQKTLRNIRNDPKRNALSSNHLHHHSDIMSVIFSKVEENFLAIMAACKDVDYTGDGSITKDDFQMILRQHNIPMALVELDKLLERCRAERSPGCVNYKDVLYKFMSRSDHGIAHKMISNPNHRFITGTKYPRGNLPVEEAEAKMVEVFHGCFLKLLGFFRQFDTADIQVISRNQFQTALEQVLNISLTEEDLQKILLQFSQEEDGLVPYPEFLGLFNKKRIRPVLAPGSAQSRYKTNHNRSQMESPRQLEESQPIDEPSQEKTLVSKNQEKKMEARYRSVAELSDLVEEAIRTKSLIAHEAFQRLDPKATGRMSRTQMHYWLQELGLLLHPTELQNLWTSLNLARDGMVHYAEVYDFFMSRYKQEVVLKSIESVHSASKVESDSKNQFKLQPNSILKRIAPKVVNNWNYIKKSLRDLDPQGMASIPISDFQSLARYLKFNLTNVELNELSLRFDFNHNGQFHYLQFLQLFLEQPVIKKPTTKYDQYTHRLTAQVKDANTTVASAMLKLRKKLLQNWQSLRRAFRKADINNDGYLSVLEFKNILSSMGINLLDEDFYHILSEFDENLDGKISYNEFIYKLIE